jgi:metallo-beta-lactamase family protein
MWLSFLGAAGTVTGSRFLFEHGGARVLVDCGMFQGERDLRRRNWAAFPVEPSTIDCVVISHAHLDHVGWLPRLVAQGFAGPVHLSPYTAELAAIVLRDAAHLQEEDAEYAGRKGYSRHSPPLPLFDTEQAERAIAAFAPIRPGAVARIGPDVTVRLHRAGHILGSSTVELRAGDRAGDGGGDRAGDGTPDGRAVVFSGDLGRPDHPLLRPPDPPPAADVIVVESTYGNRDRPPRRLDRFAEAVAAALGRGGVVLIPAFAVDRTEVVLMALRELMADGRLPRVPVYVDSPMALAALAVYRRASAGGPDLRALPPGDPFDPGLLHAARTVEESVALNSPDHPCVIVSASGMATGGRVVHHLAALAPDPRNLIVLAGFQVPGTRGRALLDGASMIKAHGRYIPVRASVLGLDEFSCHADADEILDWLRAAPRPPGICYVVHGEATASATLADRIVREIGWCAVAPRMGERVRV